MGRARDSEATRAALIAAAGELFAAHGFTGVTARQVAARAGVALSAIPYHFGSMETLYREVLLAACDVAAEAQHLAEQARAADPAEGLRLAIRWVITDLSAQTAAWPVRLIERECLDPSPTFREVVQRRFKPEWDWLAAVIGRASGQPADDEAVHFAVMTMYTLASSLLTRQRLMAELSPTVADRVTSPDFVEVLAGITLDTVARYRAVFSRPPRPTSRRKR
ncbi:MAG: CerR family C-terminal domain-containing protein [Gemmataceae bacterium]